MLLKLGKVLHGMQKDEKKKKGEEGFTLIELLVVIIIIGILAAIAIPVFLAQRERAQNASAESDVRNAATAATTWASAQPSGSFEGLTTDILEDNGATLSGDNVWGDLVDNPNDFSVQVTSVNGVTYQFDSDGDPQLSQLDPPAEEE